MSFNEEIGTFKDQLSPEDVAEILEADRKGSSSFIDPARMSQFTSEIIGQNKFRPDEHGILGALMTVTAYQAAWLYHGRVTGPRPQIITVFQVVTGSSHTGEIDVEHYLVWGQMDEDQIASAAHLMVTHRPPKNITIQPNKQHWRTAPEDNA